MRRQPRSLFRYRPLTAYSLGEMVNNTMWFAKPTTFNDPFDCALTIDLQKFPDSVEHAIAAGQSRGLIPKSLPKPLHSPTEQDLSAFLHAREKLSGAARNLGLCCFSEDPKSILMWSHYASHHRGFCTEYSFGSETMLSQEAERVTYSTKMPSLSLADLAPNVVSQTIETLWRTKAACWKYEKEWRVLAPEGNKSYPTRAPILSVTFGERMPEGDRTLVRDALRNETGIRFREACVHEGRFAIRIKEIRGG